MNKEKSTDEKRKERPSDNAFVGEGKVEPQPRRPDFFQWLEELFFGDSQFPERIEVRIVKGKGLQTMGAKLMERNYPASSAKPTREQLVKWSNEILYRCQQDCDVHRQSVAYQVGAIHFSRDNGPYDRFLIRCNPGKTWKDGVDGDEGEGEEETEQSKFVSQVMKHQEAMVGLLGSAFENFIDRQDRLVERQYARIEALEARHEKMMDLVERAASAEADRESRRKWDDIKIGSVQKGLELGFAILPPTVAALTGKTVPTPGANGQTAAISDSFEAITLRQFVQSLTNEQIDLVFGKYDETPEHKLVTQGALTPTQADLIADIAAMRQPPDRIDDLMPGGPHAISMEQIQMLLQIGVPMTALAPLKLIFDARQKRKEQGEK